MRGKRRFAEVLVVLAVGVLAVMSVPTPASTASIWDRKGMEPYQLPLARKWLSHEVITRAHHDHPAIDINVPTGTPGFAVQSGRIVAVIHNGVCGLGVVQDGNDGFRYTYCHASAALVSGGEHVRAGQKIMRTGNSGSYGTPHLHLEIEEGGRLVLKCPQPLLLSWWRGGQKTPKDAPYGGCTY